MAITIDGTNGLTTDNAALKLDGTTLTVDDTNNRVGIGTSSPAVALDVSGYARASTGILFGTDTAAANALDDYEEGTFDVTLAFGGGSVGVTYSSRKFSYTKIGNTVNINGYLLITNKGSSTGDATITGLPFVSASGTENYCAASMHINGMTFGGFPNAFIAPTSTLINLFECTDAGGATTITNSDFSNSVGIIFSFTYRTA